MTIVQLLDTVGGTEQAISFVIVGVFIIGCAKYADKKYRKKFAYLLGTFVLFSGISRGIGVVFQCPEPTLFNALFKFISGSAGMIAVYFLPRVANEISRVQTIERVREDLKKGEEQVNTLKNLSDKLDAGNPR